MPYNRKDMVAHTGQQTISGVLPPLFLAFMPAQCNVLKGFFRRFETANFRVVQRT
jgi:hypothetical protein